MSLVVRKNYLKHCQTSTILNFLSARNLFLDITSPEKQNIQGFCKVWLSWLSQNIFNTKRMQFNEFNTCFTIILANIWSYVEKQVGPTWLENIQYYIYFWALPAVCNIISNITLTFFQYFAHFEAMSFLPTVVVVSSSYSCYMVLTETI